MTEVEIHRIMNDCEGFGKVVWLGNEQRQNIAVMTLLGPSLETLRCACGFKFSMKTTLMLVDQCLDRLEQLHSRDFIHRDVKPENFLMGVERESHIVHLIDFGLSRRFRHAKNQQHIVYRENRTLTGTARYASLNAHLGIEESRRDDIESLAYMMIFFLQGSLPWQRLRAENKNEKYQKILEKKMMIAAEAQCVQLPLEVSTFLNYSRALRFEETPDYSYLHGLLRGLMQRSNLTYDYNYDWCALRTNYRPPNGGPSLKLHGPQTDPVLSEPDNEQEDVGDEEAGDRNIPKPMPSQQPLHLLE